MCLVHVVAFATTNLLTPNQFSSRWFVDHVTVLSLSLAFRHFQTPAPRIGRQSHAPRPSQISRFINYNLEFFLHNNQHIIQLIMDRVTLTLRSESWKTISLSPLSLLDSFPGINQMRPKALIKKSFHESQFTKPKLPATTEQ